MGVLRGDRLPIFSVHISRVCLPRFVEKINRQRPILPPMKAQVLIVGCGDLGAEIAIRLQQSGDQVIGVRISDKPLPNGIITIQADVTRAETLAPLVQLKPDYLIYCVAGSAQNTTQDDENYRQHYVAGLRHVLATQHNNSNLKHVFFVSSTRVYGQKTAEVIDELMPALPCDTAGERLLEAEGLLKNLACPATALRLSGIYGPGRTRMINLALKPDLWPTRVSQNSWSNRIHRDDAAAFIVFLIQQRQQLKTIEDCYIVTDSQPTTQYETLNWLATQMNIAVIAVDTITPEISGGKRLSNQRLLRSGFKLRYPNYQVGYTELLRQLLK